MTEPEDQFERELLAGLTARPQIEALFPKDQRFGESLCSALGFALDAGRPSESWPVFESATTAYASDKAVAYKIIEDYILSFMPKVPWIEDMERELNKTEAVNHLRPGQFEDFLLMSDGEFTALVTLLARHLVKKMQDEKYVDQGQFKRELLQFVEMWVTWYAEGKLIHDEAIDELHFKKPIGEILDLPKMRILMGFIQKKRPRTEEILKHFHP